jgi:hypothetical protein
MIGRLYHITSPYFVAGIVTEDDIVILAAPIVGYMKKDKWPLEKVKKYCKNRGWSIIEILSRK